MSKDNFFRKYINKKNHDPFVIKTGRFKDGNLETIYRSGWAEDVYIADSKEKETIGRNFNIKKIPWLVVFIAAAIFILVGKTAWLQIVKGDYYYQMAEGNRIRIKRVEPKRGVIYDRNMNPLVRNEANFMLYLIPADLPSDEGEQNEIIKSLSELIGNQTEEEIKNKFRDINPRSLDAFQPVFIADNIEYEKAMMLYLQTSNWPGVVLSNQTRREYLYTGGFMDLDGDGETEGYFSLSHILGYTGKISKSELETFGDEYLPIDYIGKMGIEYFWENELRGKSGKKQIEVDALGKEKKILGKVDEVDGNNLVLSLDLNQQLKLEQILAKHLKKLGKTRGSAILLDPTNGEVIALVSYPAYNNNAFARGISTEEYSALISREDKPLFNRAISGEFPSGSTVKPVIAAAALQERVISENTTFLSVGGIRIGEWFFPDWRAGGHGRVNVRRAIAESVNTFFYYIGGGYQDFTGLGVDRINKYGQLFGLGAQTGIDLAGESPGFLPTRQWKEEVKGEKWYIGDTYHLAIGQGDLLVTPLQVALFTSVFANGGKLYRPHFIREVLNSEDQPVSHSNAEAVREGFIDDYNLEVVRQGLRRGVLAGSSARLQSVPAEVAGKTGTAQWSTKHEPHAWFTGFAPYDDPELVITVLIEEGGEGSDTAVPIAQEYLTWYFGEYKKSQAEK